MKPEDVFYYSEKKGWFTKHALSVERVGLKYQMSRYRNNKLDGYIGGLRSLFEIEQQLKICVEHGLFSSDILQQFLLALEKIIRKEGVEYRIKGTCLGRVDHPELGFADIYHTFSGHRLIRLRGRLTYLSIK